MAWTPRRYFAIEPKKALLTPVVHTKFHEPFFGGPQLGTVQVLSEDGHHVTVSERNELARIVIQDTRLKGSSPFSPGLCLQMFGASARQWEDMIGDFRCVIKAATHEKYPLQIPAGKRIFDMGPRDRRTKTILKLELLPALQKTHAWLCPSDISYPSHFSDWYDAMFTFLYAEESRILVKQDANIKDHLYARPDQVAKFDWSHASMGKLSIQQQRNDEGVITGFERADISAQIEMPTIPTRPALADLWLRIVVRISRSDIRQSYHQKGQARVCPASEFMSALSLPFEDLAEINLARIEKSDLFKKLQHMLEEDLGISFSKDGLLLAWQNPRTFWGVRDSFLQIRDTDEFGAVLEELRKSHIQHKTDKAILLYLIKDDEQALVAAANHPDWPAGCAPNVVLQNGGDLVQRLRAETCSFEENEGNSSSGTGRTQGGRRGVKSARLRTSGAKDRGKQLPSGRDGNLPG